MQKNDLTIAFKKIVSTNCRFYVHSRRVGAETWDRDVHEFKVIAHSHYFKKNSVDTTIMLTGRVRNGYNDQAQVGKYGYESSNMHGVFEPTSGFTDLDTDLLQSACAGIPDDAKIALEVQLDNDTTPSMAKASLHGDRVLLIATFERNKRTITRKFLVQTMVRLHNSARFGGPSLIA